MKLLAVAAVSLLSFNVLAESSIGVLLSNVSIEESGLEVSPKMLSIQLESQQNQNLKIGAMASTGIADDSLEFQQININAEIDHALTFYTKFSPNFEDKISPYLTIGYSSVNYTAEVDSGPYSTPFSYSSTDNDILFGGGLQVNLEQGAEVFIEINKFSTADIFSVGFNVPL